MGTTSGDLVSASAEAHEENQRAKRVGQCSICGRAVVSGVSGRQKETHKDPDAEIDCKAVADAFVRLEKVLKPEVLARLNLTGSALLELRYRVFVLASEVPRARDSRGRFLRR